MKRQAGMTLLEVLIAVTLLSVLSVGMMMAMRIGISALGKVDARLMDNRRVAGAQRIVEQELQAIMPVVAQCNGDGPLVSLFSGQATSLTTVTAFSLQGAWRGRPQVIQIFTIPDDRGGVRLVVNETPYTGPKGAGRFCTGIDGAAAHFLQPASGPTTYVLADHLRGVRIQYLHLAERPEEPAFWTTEWREAGWPLGIRVEMTPLEPAPGRLQPISVTAPMYLYRDPGVKYEDE